MVGFSEFGPESRQSAFLPNSYIPKIRSFWESAGRLDRRSFLRTPDRGLTIFAPHKRTGYFASLLSPLSGQICENPVAIMNMRQTGCFPLFAWIASSAGQRGNEDRRFTTRSSVLLLQNLKVLHQHS